MSDLKPCPFCGHTVQLRDEWSGVSCDYCGIYGPDVACDETPEDAWNRRSVISSIVLQPPVQPLVQRALQNENEALQLENAQLKHELATERVALKRLQSLQTPQLDPVDVGDMISLCEALLDEIKELTKKSTQDA